MITVIEKDIATVNRGVIAHGVNCRGVMGSGVAAALKGKWPKIYTSFKQLTPGPEQLGMCDIITIEPLELYVANCYTQVNFGRDGKRYAEPSAIGEALTVASFFALATSLDLYLPQIGAGLGGLDWDADVYPIIDRIDTRLETLNIYVCVLGG